MSGFPATATYASLANEIVLYLQGFAASPDQMTVLTAAADIDDTTFNVEDVDSVSKGVAEIGDELIYINGVDESAGTFSTHAAWRGFQGTQVEAHPSGSTVRFSPSYPRSVVKREINNILLSLYPDIFAVRSVEMTALPASRQYPLPAEADHVVDVRYRRQGGFEGWNRLESWDVEHSAPSEFSTGITLDLPGVVAPGCTLQVLYAVAPTPLLNDDDVFAAVTGLSESAKEIVIYGVVYQLARAMDLARIPTQTTEADELSQTKPLGSAVQLASAFGKQYQSALERERTALKIKYPARIHRVR